MTRPVLAVCFLLSLAAAGPAAADVNVDETYYQRLAGVFWVSLDPARNPVYHTKDGYHAAATGKLVRYPEGAAGRLDVRLIDRAGRFWVRDQGSAKTWLWDGTAWEKRDHNTVAAFEDSGGRVFLFDGTAVRVRGKDGAWADQVVSKEQLHENVRFVEDANGRVWCWGSHEGSTERPAGPRGAWGYADGKWTHHHAGTGFPFDYVKWLHPVADGRLVVVADAPPKGPYTRPTAFWHPDRKLGDAAAIPFGDRPLTAAGDPVVGLDGTLYFPAGGGTRKPHAYGAVSPKGGVRELDDREYAAFRRQPHGLYEYNRIVFARPGDPPPVLPGEGDVICADREGRFYFRASVGRQVGMPVVWPKHARPGDILRTEREAVAVTNLVRDEAGAVWAEPEHSTGELLRWDGTKWQETPLKPLHRPRWIRRDAPPWSPWSWAAAGIFRLHGKDGSLLVVRVRDTYQSDKPPADDGREPVGRGNAPAFPDRAVAPNEDGNPPYWPDAWLYRGGKWVGPVDPRKLMVDERDALLADFAGRSGNTSAFTLAADGSRLWAAFAGRVLTVGKDGKLIEADAPGPKPARLLPHTLLSPLPDGRPLLHGSPTTGHVLSVSPDGKITAEPLPMPNDMVVGPRSAVHSRLAKDGTLWLWGGNQVWSYRDGRWAARNDLVAPFHLDAAGNPWCRPADETDGTVTLLCASGTETKKLAFALSELAVGFGTPPPGAVVWAGGDRLYCLEPAGASGKPALRWRVLSDIEWGGATAVYDGRGTVLLGRYRATLPPSKP